MGSDVKAALPEVWRRFAEEQCRGYSPLYERICTAVAESDAVLALVADAPPAAWQPNVLLAAAHDLVLRGVDHVLSDIYAGRSSVDPGPAFCDLVLAHTDEVAALLATLRTNTNECGRTAVVIPALRWAASRVGEPVALLDAGASAGLNLNLDRYRIDYADRGSTGPPDSPVTIACEVEGAAPIDEGAPAIAARCGLDRAPVDLTADDESRWILACVWPDTGRLDRTRAAIDIARAHPPEVVRGDMVDDLVVTAERLPSHLPLCVVTSWAVAYLRREDRRRFAQQLSAISTSRPVAWISAEGPGVVEELGSPPAHHSEGVVPSVVGCVVYDRGGADATVLGTCHPHGSWLRWTAVT